MEEIFTLVKREIYRAGMENLIASGMVLTGGAALLDGVTEMAESVFQSADPAGQAQGNQRSGRCGQQSHVRHRRRTGAVWCQKSVQKKNSESAIRNIFNRVMTRMKRWFKEVI